MKKYIKLISAVLLSAFILTAASGCKKEEPELPSAKLEEQQMKEIGELAALECYFHNVAKYFEKDASGILFWEKDKHFWVEYSGIVKLGIDVTELRFSIDGNRVTVTMPRAKVLSCKVDEATLNEDSFIIAEGSAKVTAEDQIEAFNEAQSIMVERASSDKELLGYAEQRVRELIGDYIENIGSLINVKYEVTWNYAEASSNTDETSGNKT